MSSQALPDIGGDRLWRPAPMYGGVRGYHPAYGVSLKEGCGVFLVGHQRPGRAWHPHRSRRPLLLGEFLCVALSLCPGGLIPDPLTDDPAPEHGDDKARDHHAGRECCHGREPIRYMVSPKVRMKKPMRFSP